MKRVLIAVMLLAIVAAGGFAYKIYFLDAQPTTQAQIVASVPVVVAQVERKPMPVRIDVIGIVQPIATVGVRSRIDGQISAVNIKDGQEVKAGDVLIQMDDRAIAAQLKQAQAMVVRDRANLANAQREIARYKPLNDKDFVSHEQMDQVNTTGATTEAVLEADMANVQNLQVQLDYCTIRAPMDGRVGAITLKTGNGVKENDTLIVTINQMKPIYVNFAVPQNELPAIRAAMAAGTITISVRAAGDTKDPVTGKLGFIDNQIDPATGTIAVRGVFDNGDERLWPGQFVNVQMTLKMEPDAIVMPQAALLVGQDGNYVYIAKPDNTVETRPVTVDRTMDGLTIIAKGLNEGEQVVVDGQSRVTDGTRVEIHPKGEAAVKTEPAS
jgi:membrane fusion protein, multidrug efflux system